MTKTGRILTFLSFLTFFDLKNAFFWPPSRGNRVKCYNICKNNLFRHKKISSDILWTFLLFTGKSVFIHFWPKKRPFWPPFRVKLVKSQIWCQKWILWPQKHIHRHIAWTSVSFPHKNRIFSILPKNPRWPILRGGGTGDPGAGKICPGEKLKVHIHTKSHAKDQRVCIFCPIVTRSFSPRGAML